MPALPQRLKPQLRRPSTFHSSIIQPQIRESMCGLSMTKDGIRFTESLVYEYHQICLPAFLRSRTAGMRPKK